RKHSPTVRQARGSEQRALIRIAPRRQVAERPIGADHAAIRTLEDLCRIQRVHDDGMLVRVDPAWRPQARVCWIANASKVTLRLGAESAPSRGRVVLHVEGKVG